MDSISEKNCLEEISHSIFDENEKVTLKAISNNWSITNKVAQDVLSKWLSNNKNKEFHKEFVVKGTDKNDNNYILIVQESVKNKLEKKWKNFSSWLFSLEVKSESRKLNLPDHNEIKIKNLRLNVESRDIKIQSASVPEVKKEAPAKKNVATTSHAFKKEPEPKSIPKPADPKVAEKEKPVEVKKETITPKKSSPEEHKKSPAKGKAGIKNMKPVGKGSITSFFNAKPGTANTKPSETKKTPEPADKKETPEQPKKSPEIKKEKTTPVVSKKRVLEDEKDVIPNTPEETTKSKKNEKKKLKFKSNSNNKRSRIMQLESSSESEQEEMDEPEKKLIKFDRELTPEPVIAKEPDVEMEEEPEPKAQPIKSENGVKKRVKAKKMVTKTYEDEEGFIKTVREMEEYSTSEDEVMCVPKENEKPNQKKSSQTTTTSSTTKKTPNKKAAPATGKSTANQKTKQGSIMSFFSKK